jgi:hypothetical protein
MIYRERFILSRITVLRKPFKMYEQNTLSPGFAGGLVFTPVKPPATDNSMIRGYP